ncbi:MAG TPA: jacalin-like lectin [Acidobacteriota bacterium]|nr:jacalin-like lectin [Acidobacteriota bacterium]
MCRIYFYGRLLAAVLLPAPALAQLTPTEIAGGGGGNVFSDPQPPAGSRIAEVRIFAGDTVDSIQFVYVLADGSTTLGPKHGGSGGRPNVFRLDSDEYIIGLLGRYGDTVDSLHIQTNKRSSPRYGGRGGSRDYRIEVPAGNQALGLTGRAGDTIDAIGLMHAPTSSVTSLQRRFRGLFPPSQTSSQGAQTSLAGGKGGSPFSDPAPPQGASIAEVRIQSGDRVDGIQMIYLLPDGSLLEGAPHGRMSRNYRTFRLDSDEYITGISGRYGDTVDSLQILTNKRTSQLFGGRGGDRDYRIAVPAGHQVTGFTGRSGDSIDAIGTVYSSVTLSRRLFRR